MTARDRLQKSGTAFKRARRDAERARDAVRPDIVAALRDGVQQKEIVELSGYTRETVRSIARAEGINPAAPQHPREASSTNPGEPPADTPRREP